MKVTFKCTSEDKKKFKNSSCSVTVSMGNKDQEGTRLAATLHGITNNFKECTIMVCDSLQRHNILAHNKNYETAYKKANEIGDKWLKDNEKHFSLFTIPYHVIRWDHWLLHDEYLEAKEKVEHFFKKNEEYRNAFFKTADHYTQRLKKKITAEYCNSELIIKYSLEYLKEECAVMLLWAKNKYNFEIYPSKRNDAMAATHKHFIEPETQNILTSVPLDIRTKNYVANQ